MWRRDGFALYPWQPRACGQYGHWTYLHLLGMKLWTQALGHAQALQAGPVLQQLEALLMRCRAV